MNDGPGEGKNILGLELTACKFLLSFHFRNDTSRHRRFATWAPMEKRAS